MKYKKLKFTILLTGFVSIISCAANATAQNNQEDNLPHQDVFAQMEVTRKQMDKAFEKDRKLIAKMIEDRKKNNLSSGSSSLKTTQDEKSYIYELDFSSFKKEEVMVSVKDRTLIIEAKSEELVAEEKENEQENYEKKSKASASFYYSIVVPSDADLEPQITREDKKITVKFRKKIVPKKQSKKLIS